MCSCHVRNKEQHREFTQTKMFILPFSARNHHITVFCSFNLLFATLLDFTVRFLHSVFALFIDSNHQFTSSSDNASRVGGTHNDHFVHMRCEKVLFFKFEAENPS